MTWLAPVYPLMKLAKAESFLTAFKHIQVYPILKKKKKKNFNDLSKLVLFFEDFPGGPVDKTMLLLQGGMDWGS